MNQKLTPEVARLTSDVALREALDALGRVEGDYPCHQCGGHIECGVIIWHSVLASNDEDGERDFRPFCSDACHHLYLKGDNQ